MSNSSLPHPEGVLQLDENNLIDACCLLRKTKTTRHTKNISALFDVAESAIFRECEVLNAPLRVDWEKALSYKVHSSPY